MIERQYPIHLRRIGEPEIADYLESLVIEVDTHEKMFLELCELRRQKEALEDIIRGRCDSIEDCTVSKDSARVALRLIELYINAHPEEKLVADYSPVCGFRIGLQSDREVRFDAVD